MGYSSTHQDDAGGKAGGQIADADAGLAAGSPVPFCGKDTREIGPGAVFRLRSNPRRKEKARARRAIPVTS